MKWDAEKTQKMIRWMETWLVDNPLPNEPNNKVRMKIAHDAWLEMRRLEERAKRAAARELRISRRESK